MTDHIQERRLVGFFRCRWYLLDILLVAGVVLGGGLLHFLCVIGYVAGVRNDRGMIFTVPCVFMLTFGLVGVFCLISLLTRMALAWPRHISGRRKLWGYRLFVTAGLAGYFVLPFTDLIPSGLDGFMSGFRQHVRKTADIPAIQAWLSALSPELCTGEPILLRRNGGPAVWPDTTDWPVTLARFDCDWATFEKTEGGRLKLRLTWGTPWAKWGVEIGPADMEIPKTQDQTKHVYGPPEHRQVMYDHGEYRLPLAPGAYVWHEIR
jgi:hypothetical protein